jgi:TonB-linked SusC/RagA family outer membrane protein
VIGFGTQSKATLTTSISKLDNKVLENIPYSNAASALEGTIPGLKVQSISGQPGAAPRIILRGGTSINNPTGATPLYIIDGVTRTDMNNISSSDIKSIQVLKDAASTAIYGARGSNGVIIIETKSGVAGKTQVSYKFDLTNSMIGKKWDLLDGRDYVYYSRLGMAATAGLNAAYIPLLTGSTYPGGTGNDLTNNTALSTQFLTPQNQYKLNEGWQSQPDPLDPTKTLIFSSTDYQDLLYRTAVSQKHSITVSGGTQDATFNLGLGYQDAQGLAIQTDYKLFSMNLNGDVKVSKNINIFGRVMYSYSANHQLPSVGGLFAGSVIQGPDSKHYFEDGTLASGRSFGFSNPIYQVSTYIPKNNEGDLTVIVGGKWKILPGLTFTPQASLYQTNAYVRNFQKAYFNGPTTLVTSRNASANYTQLFSPQASAVLSYNKAFSDVHHLEAQVGFSYFENDNTFLGANGSNAASDLIPTLNASATPASVSGSEDHQIILGYFSRITYDYKLKYLLSASMRYDGASNLGANNKWGLFPGISAGWVLNKEKFWSIFPQNLFTLKLRGSYGVNGNISGLGPYQAQGAYSTAYRYAGNAAIQIQTLPNQDLKWEQSKTTDIGMDMGILHDRVGITLDYYRRVTSNLLTTLSMPPSTGFSSVLTNYGTLENKGLEIGINAQIINTSIFQWNVSANIAHVNTKILKLPPNGIKNNRVGGVYVWDSKTKTYDWKGGLQEGGRIGDEYGYKQVNIYATDAQAAAGPIDMLIPRTNKTKYGGDVNWLDPDGNDTINTRDQVYMGNPYPTVTGGFTNTFSYKNFSLYVRMDYTLGATIYNETAARLEGNFNGANALSTNVLRSWKKQGDITDIPKYYWADQNAQWNVWNGRGSSRFFQSENFLCVREITIAYNLPQNILNKLKIADIRFHVTGNNLYYFTGYQGLNPEETATYVSYPNPRSIIVGASITF